MSLNLWIVLYSINPNGSDSKWKAIKLSSHCWIRLCTNLYCYGKMCMFLVWSCRKVRHRISRMWSMSKRAYQWRVRHSWIHGWYCCWCLGCISCPMRIYFPVSFILGHTRCQSTHLQPNGCLVGYWRFPLDVLQRLWHLFGSSASWAWG